jgi:hypothetical protein
MLTSLPATPEGLPPEKAHGWLANSTPALDATLHNAGNPLLDYVPSVFDVVHDHGQSTALFASKPKFALYTQSYVDAGAPDLVGCDDGVNKIDQATLEGDITLMTDALVELLHRDPPNFTFVHFALPDSNGHAAGWGSDPYMVGVSESDAELGRIVEAIEADERLDGHTALIVTTDHGGVDYNHGDQTDPLVYVIPFYVWGPGIRAQDLYDFAEATRQNPGEAAPPYTGPQPVRTGDAGNQALELLGLPAIPGSFMRGMRLPLEP